MGVHDRGTEMPFGLGERVEGVEPSALTDGILGVGPGTRTDNADGAIKLRSVLLYAERHPVTGGDDHVDPWETPGPGRYVRGLAALRCR